VPSRTEQKLCRPYLDEEITLIDPILIIPIGRLAIELFYHDNFTLDQVVGTHKQINGRWIVPLPHPSGASRWHQVETNRQLINQAITFIKAIKEEYLI
jgi:uracil-DNA glycosylase